MCSDRTDDIPACIPAVRPPPAHPRVIGGAAWVFTEEALATARAMREDGKSNREIAIAINSTEQSVVSTMCRLRISKSRMTQINVRMKAKLAGRLRDEAYRRNIRVEELAQRILVNVAGTPGRKFEDNLFAAILDE